MPEPHDKSHGNSHMETPKWKLPHGSLHLGASIWELPCEFVKRPLHRGPRAVPDLELATTLVALGLHLAIALDAQTELADELFDTCRTVAPRLALGVRVREEECVRGRWMALALTQLHVVELVGRNMVVHATGLDHLDQLDEVRLVQGLDLLLATGQPLVKTTEARDHGGGALGEVAL